MSRTLTTEQQSAVTTTVTTPGYLVELGYSTTLRLSSRGDQSWDGNTWMGGRMGKISGLVATGGGDQLGRIELVNSDLAYSALVLNEGATDIRCRVWVFYGDNPADASLLLDGVTDGADIAPDKVRLNVVGESMRTASFPRRVIGPSTGFNHLRPSGTRITWGGQTYVLERGNR